MPTLAMQLTAFPPLGCANWAPMKESTWHPEGPLDWPTGEPSTLQMGSEVAGRGGPSPTEDPLVTALPASSLLQEGQRLWRSHVAEEPEPKERLSDTVCPAAGYDVFYSLPLAPGLLPPALPPAGRHQILMRVSA